MGKVTYKRPFGIIVTLTMLESGCNRDFSDLDIQVYYQEGNQYYIVEDNLLARLKKDCEESNIAGMFQTILDACMLQRTSSL